MRPKKTRRPWLAGLLSWIVPGQGQLYNGRPLRGLAIFVGSWLVVVACYEIALNWDAAPWNVAFAGLLLLGYFVFAIWDAVRDARRNREEPVYGRWYAHLLIALTWVFAVAPMAVHAIRTSIGQTFQVPGGGMEQTILVGEYVLADKAAFGIRSPWGPSLAGPAARPLRNQVVVYRAPEDPSKFLVKRIVALPGETVEIQNKQLFINEVLAREPFIVHIDPTTFLPPSEAGESPSRTAALRDNFGPFRVPEDTYFGLGDNRDNSFDSRFQGPIAGKEMVGVVRRIYWSRDSNARRVRWERIGKSVS